MNIYLRGLLVLVLLISTLKLYNYMNKSPQQYVFYLSYVVTFLSLALISSQSHRMFQEIKQKREQNRFQKLNTKAKWLASLQSPDDLQYLMKKQKTADLLIYKVKTAKQSIYRKDKFQNLLAKYIEVLKEKIPTQIGEAQRNLIDELQKHQKQLEISYLIEDQEFSYQKLVQYYELKREHYIQKIIQLDITVEEKRELIASHFPFIVQYIQPFLNQYMQFSAELRKQFFITLMFTPFQINELNKSLQFNPLQNQSKFYHLIINNLTLQLRNYSLALSLLEQLLSVELRQATEEQKTLLFYLKLISLQLYHNHHLQIEWKQFITKDKYLLFKQIMPFSNIDTIKSTFDLIHPTLFQKYLTQYTFQSKLSTKQIIDYFNQNHILPSQTNILSFITYLKTKTVDQCYHYKQIIALLTPYRNNKEISSFLQLLKYCRIFYSFNLSTQISLIEQLSHSQNKKLQQRAVVLFREMVKSFSINKMRNRYIDLDGQQFDLHAHQSIIKLSLYLKKNFFKRLLTEQTMYQMIFQHLIHFERYGILVSLLREQILEKYMIDYNMIEIVIIEQIHTLFQNNDSFLKIEPDVQRLIGLLTNETLEKLSVKGLIEVAKILKRNKLAVDPQIIIKNMNVDLLRTVVSKKVSIDSEELHKIYKQILLFKNPTFEEPDMDTKDYQKFKTWLAKKYYDIGLHDEGLELIRGLIDYKLPELCNAIMEIIKAHPQTADTLLFLGYDQATTVSQFEYFRQKFAENKKKDKQITDYVFSDRQFITDDRIYSNVVAECKFIDHSLKNPIFEMFFLLLGNNYKQAFFNAYKRKLPLHQIDFFLKECIKNGILDLYKVIPWMYKTLLAKNLSKTFGIQTSYSKFIENLDAQNKTSESQKYYTRLQNNPEVDPLQKGLLKKYHSMAQIWCIANKQFLAKYLKQKDIGKFLEDKAFRKKEITELASKIQQQDAITLNKLARVEQINLLDLSIFNICGYLNTQKVPQNIQQYLINTTLLTGKTKEGANALIEKLVAKIFSTRILLSLIYGLMKLKDGFWREYFKDNPALRILETLAAVEEESEFYGLLPNDMFTKQIKPSFVYEPLSFKKANILNNCIKMQNVFVVSKAMYLLHGFSSEVEKQVFQILCDKSPEAQKKLSKLLQ